MKKTIKLIDLDCGHCAAKIENAVKKIDGVTNVSVSFIKQKMDLEAPDDKFDAIFAEAKNLCRFFLFSLVNQQMQIHDKQNTLDALQSQLKTQQIKNEELKNSLEKDEDLADYAEKVARRDLDYAKPGERVFVDVGGSD